MGGRGRGELPTDGSDLVSRRCGRRPAIADVARGRVPPAIRSRANRIPLAAASALGRRGRCRRPSRTRCSISTTRIRPRHRARGSAEIEGHPDNAAAAASAASRSSRTDDVERLDRPRVPPSLFVPAIRSRPRTRPRCPDGDPRGRRVQRRARALVVGPPARDPDRLLRWRCATASTGRAAGPRPADARGLRATSIEAGLPVCVSVRARRCSRSSATGVTARSRRRLADGPASRARAGVEIREA